MLIQLSVERGLCDALSLRSLYSNINSFIGKVAFPNLPKASQFSPGSFWHLSKHREEYGGDGGMTGDGDKRLFNRETLRGEEIFEGGSAQQQSKWSQNVLGGGEGLL